MKIKVGHKLAPVMAHAKTWMHVLAAVAAGLLLGVDASRAGIVFQADFNGAGAGTGGSGDIVTFGGTGALVSGTNLAASIGTSSPLFAGAPGYLRVTDTGAGVEAAGTGGVDLFPSSAAHSLDSWLVLQSGSMAFSTVNGALDFFFRTSVPSSAWPATWTGFRPIVADGGNGGLGLKFNSTGPSTLRAEIYAVNSQGTPFMSIVATASNLNLAANTLYHLALTVSTNASGIITLKVFLAPGNSPIDTQVNDFLIASANGTAPLLGTGANAVTHAFNSATSFRFGQCFRNDADSKVIDYGSLRIYDASPTSNPTVFTNQTVFRAAQYLPYLPDLPNVAGVNKPNPLPTLPSGFDVFSPPVIPGGAAAANTPIAGEWTRAADAGESIILAGSKLTTFTGTDAGKDSGYLAFGQNGSSLQLQDSLILRQDGNNAALTLGDTLPSPAMVFVWPRNANGYGRPFAVNRTEAWWVGPDKATRGDTISLYGRNLTYGIAGDSDNRSWIYIKPAGAAGQWVTPTAVNPYKVDFIVPASLANGAYEVWAHNGHGGHYGWGRSVILTVSNATINNNAVWTGPTFNVKTAHGAAGNGTADDTAEITSALAAADAAADYATVYFPTGTYLVSSRLTIPAKVRLLGDGASLSALKAATVDFSQGGDATKAMLLRVNDADNSAIQKLKLNAGQSTNCLMIGRVGTGPDWFQVADCVVETVNSSSQSSLDLYECKYLFLQRTTFNGMGITITDGSHCFVDSCNFNGMWGLPLLYIAGNSSQMSYTNNVGQDYNNYLGRTYHLADLSAPEGTKENQGYYDNDPNLTGWCQPLLVKGQNGTGARHNTYFGNNTTLNMGARLWWTSSKRDAQNNPVGQTLLQLGWGEQLGFEHNFAQYLGTPTAATATSMTFTGLASQYADVRASLLSNGHMLHGIYAKQAISTAEPPETPLIAAIVYGTGTGQWRDVGKINTTTGVVTLVNGQSWNVVPDSTSKITLAWYCANAAAYNNNFTGKADRVGPNGGYNNLRPGIKGIIAYAGVLNLVYDSNTVNYGDSGITETGFTPRDVGPLAITVMPNYFNLFLNNTFHNCRTVFKNSVSAYLADGFTMRALFGNVYRKNTADNTVPGTSVESSYFWTWESVAPELDMVLFELNDLDDINKGVQWGGGGSVGNVLFVANSFTRGSASSSGSFGMALANTKHALLGNTYTGFATTYTGSPLGPILEEPLRVFDLTSTGAPVSATLSVWNAGTSSLAWSASSNAAWLTVSPISGSVADERSASGITLTCNPSGLANGVHTATVTLLSGSQTKKARVNFTVNAGAVPQLASAAWRENHGGTNLDVALPLSAPTAVECRAEPAATSQIVFTFDQAITAGSAAVTAGSGSVTAAAISGSTMLVTLSGVVNQQVVTLTASNVANATGQTLPSASVSARVLRGDTNGDGVVNAVDLSGVRNSYGTTAGQAGFNPRADLNVDGVVNSVDVSVIRTNYGTQLLP